MTQIVIPAAGLGTRFAPYTQIIPKELLPLITKPALEHILKECEHAQATDIIVINHPKKQLIADFLQKYHYPTTIMHQHEQRGLGHAVLMAEHAITDPFFGICLPDDIIISSAPAIGTLHNLSRQYQASIIAVEEVPAHLVQNYGIISSTHTIDTNLFEIDDIIEKPLAHKTPSRYAVIGRYWLSRDIFSYLHKIPLGVNNELQLTDALRLLLKSGHRILAYKISGTRYDIGTPLGWTKAVLDYSQQLITF